VLETLFRIFDLFCDEVAQDKGTCRLDVMAEVLTICQAVRAHKDTVRLAIELDLLLGMLITELLVRPKFLGLQRFQQIEDTIVLAKEVRVREIYVALIERASFINRIAGKDAVIHFLGAGPAHCVPAPQDQRHIFVVVVHLHADLASYY
jgi:hypothetical protein